MNGKQIFFSVFGKFSLIVIVLASLIFGIYSISNYESPKNSISYDEALSRIKSREIKQVIFKNNEAKLRFKSKQELIIFKVSEEQEEGLLNAITEYNVTNSQDHIAFSMYPTDTNPNSTFNFNSSDRVFQLIFILFIISPPLIVLMLFLIWRELKERNRLK